MKLKKDLSVGNFFETGAVIVLNETIFRRFI